MLSPFFWSFEANNSIYLTRLSGKMGQNDFSAVGSLFSDRLLGSLFSVWFVHLSRFIDRGVSDYVS